MDFRSATADFLADRVRRGCMPSSLYAYTQLLRWFTEHLESRGLQDTESITVEDIEAYVGAMRTCARPLSEVTIHRRMTTLRVYLAWCIYEGAATSSLIRKTAWPKKPDRLPKALSHAQAARLLSMAVHPRDRAIIAFLLDTGLREAECCALDLCDVDIYGGTAFVRCGKGGRQRYVVFSETTTGYLNEWLAVRVSDTPAFFVSLQSNAKGKRRGGRLNENGLYQAVKRVAEAAGLCAVTVHALRHTFATHALDNDAHIEVVSDLMGHKDISTTMIYTKISLARKRRAHAQFSPVARLTRNGG